MRSQGLSCVWTWSEPFQAAFTLKKLMTNHLIRRAYEVLEKIQDPQLRELVELLARTLKETLQELKNARTYLAPRVEKKDPPLETIIEILETWDAQPAWIRGDKKLLSSVMSNAIARCYNITSKQMRKFQGRKSDYYKKYYGVRKVEYPSQARSASGDIVTVIGPPLLIHNIPWSPATNGSREPVFIQTKSYQFFPIGAEEFFPCTFVDGEMVVRQSKIR